MEEYRQITLDEWTQWKEDIRRKLAETAENFVYIGYRLRQIRDSGMYDGAEDIFGFAWKEYGLGKSTVSRFIAINEKYSEGGNSPALKEEFRNFSSSKLSEMLTLPDSEIRLITEKTTIREIRELKAFNGQTAQETGEPQAEEAGEPAEAAGGEERSRTPLEKCLTDFFKDKKNILNGVMRYLEEEPPAYREAAELVAPSQTSHRKGIVFLFLYDWNTGVKYKLMTEPEPVSMSWAAFFDIVSGIFGTCEKEDVWGDFYKEPEEQKEDKRAGTEKAVPAGSDQGTEPVATSQQNEEKEQAGGHGRTPENGIGEAENRNRQEAAGGGNEESSTQGETGADSGEAGESAAGPESADKENGAGSGAGEDSAGGGADGESSAGEPDADTGAGTGEDIATEAAGVEAAPEKPEENRTERAAGVDFTNKEGVTQHAEKQKEKIREKLCRMESLCGSGDWNGLIEEAGYIIAIAESIRNMEEIFNS